MAGAIVLAAAGRSTLRHHLKETWVPVLLPFPQPAGNCAAQNLRALRTLRLQMHNRKPSCWALFCPAVPRAQPLRGRSEIKGQRSSSSLTRLPGPFLGPAFEGRVAGLEAAEAASSACCEEWSYHPDDLAMLLWTSLSHFGRTCMSTGSEGRIRQRRDRARRPLEPTAGPARGLWTNYRA